MSEPKQPQTVPAKPCSVGGEHVFVKDFTTCGIILGICCFPIGILCCLGLMEVRCNKCGEAAE
jgi:hypothetical protein